MNEPEQERSALSMALSAVLGAGAGAAAGKYGMRHLPAVKKYKAPGAFEKGGAGWDEAVKQKELFYDVVADLSRQRGSKYVPERKLPDASDLEDVREMAEGVEALGTRISTGLGGVVGAGTGLAFAPKHDVYKEPLRG